MNKNTLFPVAGAQYIVTEWDGSKFTVKVTEVVPGERMTSGTVTIQYDDGLTQKVSCEYFINGLAPAYAN